MRKLIVLLILAGGCYLLYDRYITTQGAFDESGNPSTVVFTMNNTAAMAPMMFSILRGRNIAYEEVNVELGDEQIDKYKKYGGKNVLPMIVMGNRHLHGFNEIELIAALMEVYGEKAMTGDEKRAMKAHFDDNGNPLVILYSTSGCGYCRKMRNYLQDKGIEFKECDIDSDRRARARYRTLQGCGVPVTYVGYTRVIGNDYKKLNQALKQL